MRLAKYVIPFFVLFFVVNSAYSSTFVEELLSRELKAIEKSPTTPDAEIHVLRIYAMWDAVGPERVIAALDKAVSSKRLSLRARARVAYLLAMARARTADVAGAKKAVDELGFISRWMVAGPFNNEGGGGLDATYPPEIAGNDPFSPMTGNGYPVEWREAIEQSVHLGFLHMEALHHPVANSCFFARHVATSPRKRSGVLRIGAGGATKVYWNGIEVLKDDKYRLADPDRLAAEVTVEKGQNTLLVKVCTEETGDFGVFARLSDRRFNPLILTPVDDQRAALSIEINGTKRFRRIPQPAQTLFEAAVGDDAGPKARATAAEYLYLTLSHDQNTTEARDMAKRSCLDGKDFKNCLLWSSVALDRNESRLALDTARQKSPDNLEVLIALARWEMDGPEPGRALALINKVYSLRKERLEAGLLEIDLLSRRGFPKSAFKKAVALRENHPNLPGLVDLLAILAEDAGYRQKALALKGDALKLNFDDVSRHDEAAMVALSSGDFDALDTHIANLRAIAPFSDSVHRYIATLLEGRNAIPLAEEALRTRLLLAPRNADALVDLGLFLMRTGRRERGIEQLVAAAEIKPQDAWLSEYLTHLGPATPFEEPYIIPESLYLSWRGEGRNGNESRYLVDQTVVKVHESGLSSRFVQQVFEIRNKEEAKEWRARYIQYLPGDQLVKILSARVHHPDGRVEKVVGRGTIPISEPWYRLYYDVAAEAVEFPKLAPGDVVELMYRVDDVATRNIFHDYFGDFIFIDEMSPKTYWQYVLIAPDSREFRFNKPDYPGLEQQRTKEDGDVVYTFRARDVPSLHREGDMPGLVEVASFLHVSTYRSWEELGEWYRGLVRHQMVPDQRIREKVKELVRGKKGDIEKIAAIYNWVVTATRYVGLEFGIHGYKPYKAPLVVSRGFGDCKDKASLLVTMLNLAGIEAEFVLIRTNDLGRLPKEPASLAVFNHAIARVSKYDLYLDGTAEQHGIHELPFGDQGATAVLLQKDGAKFVTTPVAPPEHNTTKVETTVVLDEKGDATLETAAVIKGTAAAPLRKMLEAEATRRKRFEGSLAAIYPGATLDALEVTSLSDLSKPAAYKFSATVPAYAESKNGTIEIPLDEGLNLLREYARLPKRAYDLILGAPRILARTVRITPPDGFVLDGALPAPVSVETPFGSLVVSAKMVGKTLVLERRFAFSIHRVSPDDYPEFVAFCREVDTTLATRLVLRRGK